LKNHFLHRSGLACIVGSVLLGSIQARVEVKDLGDSYEMGNGILRARISKEDGTLIQLSRDGTQLISGGTGYWSYVGGSEGGKIGGFPAVKEMSGSVRTEGGSEVAEVRLHAPYTSSGRLPCDVTFYYALRDKTEGLYVYAVFDHQEQMPGFGFGEARYVVKPDPAVFDTISIDATRTVRAPSGEDWDNGTVLNLKEVKRLNSGVRKGEVEHKYDYSALFSESPAYGWVSSQKKLGLWMVNPSLEYIAGGPTKPELTAHLDVNRGGRPVLLNMWHGSHYGGTVLSIKRGEKWQKIIGPFLLLTNQGEDPVSLWKKAMASTASEAQQWPYAWVTDPAYAATDRSRVSGHLKLPADVTRPPRAIWVGLTAPDYQVQGRSKNPATVSWQRDSRNYQYWIKALPDGSFMLPSVRPGKYTLHAFADGIRGEFSRENITVTQGKPLTLGEMIWPSDRKGKLLWEIGTPDRDSLEFADAANYWKWGNYLRYQQNFPNGMDYTIGKSTPGKDWNFCQPLKLDAKGKVIGSTTAKIHFTLDSAPRAAVLKIDLCGAREGCVLQIRSNGTAAGKIGPTQENGVMHRDGHRGLYMPQEILLDGKLLKTGENVIELELQGQSWHQGIIYDYLSLEETSS
jgi:rhamnogalacturonan endolyase